jgi:membrane-bound lytic murein transglycosylase D
MITHKRSFWAVLPIALLVSACSLQDPLRTKSRDSAEIVQGTGGARATTAMVSGSGSARPEAASWSDAVRKVLRTPVALPSMQPDAAPDTWVRAQLGFAFREHLDHPRVAAYVEHYLEHPNILQVASARAQPFAHFILREIELRQLPGELLLLPIVESGFAPEATSRSQAAGLWQFIPSTGQHYGLLQNGAYDGRRDVHASTHAALDYLERLHARFDDWYLALAAYNAGQGTVARAIAANAKAGKPTDYWHLELPSEAMGYVPRLLALRALLLHVDTLNLEVVTIANEPFLEAVGIHQATDLEYVAQLAEIPLAVLRALNPGYRQWIAHPELASHVLLPVDGARKFQAAVRRLGPEVVLVRHREYAVQSGDTLGQIARRHGVTVGDLQAANALSGTLIRVGQTLRIPVAGSSSTVAARDPTAAVSPTRQSPTRTETRPASARPVSSALTLLEYSVRRGDSLWSIARAHGVNVAQLLAVNALAVDSVLQPGQILRIPVPQRAVRVQDVAVVAAAPGTAPPSASEADVTAAQPLPGALEQVGIGGNAPDQKGIAPEQKLVEYEILPGDSLGAISQRFQVGVQDLRRWNALRGDRIRAGDTLVFYIPAPVGQQDS